MIDRKLPRCKHRHTILTHASCFPRPGHDEKIYDIQPKEEWQDKTRIGFLDIETTHLKSNMGIVLSWYIKPYKEDVYDKYVLSRNEVLTKGKEDKRAIIKLGEALSNYGMIVTYYGKFFDIPFIRHRALIWDVEFPVYRQLSHLDLYFQVKSKLKNTSNSLAATCKSFGIVGKTEIDWQTWRWAAKGDKAALLEVDTHNKGDVDILEALYDKLVPYIRSSKTSI